MNFQLECLESQVEALLAKGIKVVVGDGFYAKKKFIDGVTQADMHLVTRLRKDANLRYYYEGGPTGKPGRPKIYDGKVEWSDLGRFESIPSPKQGVELKWAVVNSPCFKRKLKVVAEFKAGQSRPRRVLMSTDVEMEAVRIWEVYTKRFQHEYVFRDGKGMMGLADGQMRDQLKRQEHLNASLTALNLLRLWERSKLEEEERAGQVISVARWKRRLGAEYLAQRIIEESAANPELPLMLDDITSSPWFRLLAS